MKSSKEKMIFNSLPKALFIFALCILSMLYGFFAFPLKWFPYSLIINAAAYVNKNNFKPTPYVKTDYIKSIPVYKENSVYNGLSLVTSVIEDNQLSARVINMKGDLIHEWEIDWFELWPDVTHIPKSDPNLPKSRPGTLIHGAILLENGDLIFNFTDLGMVRLDACGKVVWRLPYRTHHSIYLDEYGNLWVSGIFRHEDFIPNFPNQQPPFDEFTVLKVSLEGEILKEISVFDLLKQNGLEGLIYISGFGDQHVNIPGDPLHLNDVETFPSSMDEGVFKHGDIMVSLRNINTVLVFREDDLKITHVSTGEFVRQHDPDFIDGNTISVFDNYSIAPEDYGHQSRIMIKSFATGQNDIYYTGNKQHSFYTVTMGNHQWLPNGNLLITESTKGRAFEIDEHGNIVWDFVNLVGNGEAGWISDVQRLPVSFTEEFFEQLTKSCLSKLSDF